MLLRFVGNNSDYIIVTQLYYIFLHYETLVFFTVCKGGKYNSFKHIKVNLQDNEYYDKFFFQLTINISEF